jgi:large subunit ribosomal protein L32
MAVPKKRVSKQRQRKRRGHHKAPMPTLGTCEKTGAPTLRHRVCPTSGMYRGRVVLDIPQD